MEHHNLVSILILTLLACILYKLYYIEIEDKATLMFYYIVLLDILSFVFDNLYDAFGETCL